MFPRRTNCVPLHWLVFVVVVITANHRGITRERDGRMRRMCVSEEEEGMQPF